MKRLTTIMLLFVEFIGYGQTVPFQKDKEQLEQFANQNRTQNALGFIENKGQIVDQNGDPNTAVKYLLNIPGFNIQLRAKGWSYDTYIEESTSVTHKIGNRTVPAAPIRHYHRVDVELRYTNSEATMIAEDPNSDFLNYYTSDLHPEGITGVRHFKKVTYKNIYDNIDLVFKNTPEHGVEYDFIVHPGGDPDDIVLEYSGQNEIVLKEDNSFDVRVVHGVFSESIPRSYLDDLNSIKVGYVKRDANSIGFSVPSYDKERTLVIDPAPTRLWYTFYGDTQNDGFYGMDYDATNQRMYLTGYTASSSNIATGGAVVQNTYGTNVDAMVVKLDLLGGRVWGTYMGGTSLDYGVGVVVDQASGDVFVGGLAGGDGPFAGGGAFQAIYGGGTDVFVMRLVGGSGARTWGTFYGGTLDESLNAITATSNGVYIIGSTQSDNGIASPAGYDVTYHALNDIFVVKLGTTGFVRFWGTYLGGPGEDFGAGINADVATNAVYVFGQTENSGLATTGQTTHAGVTDAILVRLREDTGFPVWSTYFGGDDEDAASYMDMVGGTDLYCTGYTASTGTQLSSSGAYQDTHGGGTYDIYLAKFSASTGAKLWSTYYGGSGDDKNFGAIDADALGNILLGGYTDSDDIPGHTYLSGPWDGLLVKFNSNGERQWGMDIGGLGTSDDDYVYAVKSDGARPWIAGETDGTNLGLFASGAFRGTSGGGYDGFVMRFTSDTPTGSPTSIVLSPGSTTMSVSFVATSTATSYLALRKAGSVPTGSPADGYVYTIGSVMGDGIVAYVGTGNTFTDSGLNPATAYHYRIFAFNGTGSATAYNSSFLQGNATTVTLAAEPATQPTTLNFTNITATTFDIDFSAASPAPTGYIGIAAPDLASLTGPLISDGVTYTSGDGVGTGSAFVSFVGTGTSYNATGADIATTLYYQVYSYNGTGQQTNYNMNAPLTGNVTTLNDDTHPYVESNSTATSVAKGADVQVTAHFTDPETGIKSAYIYYVKSSDVKDDYSAVTEGTMINTTGNTYTFTIPGSFVEEPGAFYYFYLINGVDLEDYSTDYEVAVQFSGASTGLSIPFDGVGTEQTNYRIVSVPLNPAAATVSAVFGDDLGAVDNSEWRMYHYDNSTATTKELGSSSAIQLGQGYWLLSKSSKNLDSGPGTTPGVSLYEPVKIPISSGWNQIGNPYPYNVSWQAILDWNSNPVEIQKFHTYKGSWSSTDATRLEKFSGGFVFASASLTNGLEIPIYKDGTIQSGRLADPPPTRTLNAIDQQDWEVMFNLKSGILSNDLGGIGMSPQARDDFDRLDDINLPRFLDYLELSHTKEILKYHFSKDVVHVSDNHTWEFSVETNLSSPVQLEWDNSYFGNNFKELVLWDVSQQLAINMREHTSYRFDPAAGKSFKVFFGERDYVNEKALPNRLMFHTVFPNPSPGKFTFAFSTPDRPDDKWVSLEVVDVMGRRVATVTEGIYPAGYHEVSWNPVDNTGSLIPGNMYIARLRTSTSEIPKKIILE